jgi:hypothetical protein
LKSFKSEVKSEVLEDFVRLMAGNSEELRLLGENYELMKHEMN